MTTEQTAEKPKSMQLVLKSQLEKMKPEIAQIIPAGTITADRQIKVVLACTMKNPDLLKCDLKSILLSVQQASELGLELGGVLGARQPLLAPHGIRADDPKLGSREACSHRPRRAAGAVDGEGKPMNTRPWKLYTHSGELLGTFQGMCPADAIREMYANRRDLNLLSSELDVLVSLWGGRAVCTGSERAMPAVHVPTVEVQPATASGILREFFGLADTCPDTERGPCRDDDGGWTECDRCGRMVSPDEDGCQLCRREDERADGRVWE